MTEEIEEKPNRKQFPYTSKSKIGDLDYCKYSFYLDRIKGEREPKREDAVEGTNLHMVFDNFYKKFNSIFNKHKDVLFSDEMTDNSTRLEMHPFRQFVYEACMKYVKPEHRTWDKYKSIITYFATIETKNWLRLNTLFNNKIEIKDCFLPLAVEKKIEIKELHLEGIIDRIGIEVLPGGVKRVAIYEYKTGSVPKSVRTHIDTGNYLGWKLPTYASKEIHFYALLYLLKTGWTVTDEIKDFLESEDWWFVKKNGMSYKDTLSYKKDYVTNLQKKYRLFKQGKALKASDIVVGYYYLNGGYKAIKKFSYASLKGVYRSINDYRSIIHNKFYTTHPRFVFNEWGCEAKNCGRFDDCRKKMEEWYESRS